MKKRIQYTMASVLCLLVASLAWAEMPEPGLDALWIYISRTSTYSSWGFWPDHQGMREGSAPHRPLHKVYVNEAGLTSAKPLVNVGTIVVKENHNEAEERQALTVMYKIKGYNPEAGDWFWAKYDTNGKADRFGKPAGGISCHGGAAAGDYILIHSFD
ncbi:cytochrome P460 family protein [Desulfosediminicola ganghwensis]|uniref:cytochrome P460 family protein n=1 Tax=Desulfosediminicola ganghwensis TaxID=2569540 RepID=UPI0010ACDFA8|nr:cytochrome P460 family protein [Desulfosediminicola ganghwensis]